MSLLAPWLNTNRTCSSTAINSRLAWGWCVLVLLLNGCSSVRPIIKIGLIAPFEGLYRESGYAALAGTRQAITACAPPGVDVLPLALDGSGDPALAHRAAQKLLVDPAVHAVVGPFLLDTVPAVNSVLSTAHLTWVIPSLVAPDEGFAAPGAGEWLAAQVEYVAAASGASRVLLLGLPADWQVPLTTTVTLLRVDNLETARATLGARDVVLWAGPPDAGARSYAILRDTQPQVAFWLAAQAGVDIFAAHVAVQQEGQADDQPAPRWLVWRRGHYNDSSQPEPTAIQPTDATRDLAYHATCAALSTLAAPVSVPAAANTTTVDAGTEGAGTGDTGTLDAGWSLQDRLISAPTSTHAR